MEVNIMAEESRKEARIIETAKINLDEPLTIFGFAGAGLVGGIAVMHIIDSLKMKEIAHVRSKSIPPAVVFLDGQLRYPLRIYGNRPGNICCVVSELPFSSEGLYPLASALLDWAEQNKVKESVVLEGIPLRGMPKERKVFCAAESEKRADCENKGLEILKNGMIGGIAGSILNQSLARKITGVAFLTPTISFMPDPEGAAVLIDALNNVYTLEIETKTLSDSAKKIKTKLKEIAQRRQKMTQSEEKTGIAQRYYT
jgi:uncharacterized protein